MHVIKSQGRIWGGAPPLQYQVSWKLNAIIEWDNSGEVDPVAVLS